MLERKQKTEGIEASEGVYKWAEASGKKERRVNEHRALKILKREGNATRLDVG